MDNYLTFKVGKNIAKKSSSPSKENAPMSSKPVSGITTMKTGKSKMVSERKKIKHHLGRAAVSASINLICSI